MRILYLNFDRGIPVLGDKGASVHVREFARAAAESGHEVLLACARLGEGNEAPPVQMLELMPECPREAVMALAASHGMEAGCRRQPLLDQELSKLIYDERVGEHLLAGLAQRGFEPELIYERHALFSSAGVRVAQQLRCPRVLEVNAPLADEQKRFRGLSLEPAARRMEVESFRAASAIVAVSEQVRSYIHAASGVGLERIHVVANGVDVARFASALGREVVRQRLGYGTDAAAIGFIGSFKPWHGTSFLLDAFEEIAPSRSGARLFAVGDGPQRAELCERVEASPFRDRVCLPGRIPHAEIPAWVAAADIVAAPYEAIDGFYFSPLKVLEALAGGRPVVAPRIGQLVELVDHGRTGLLYAPGDAKAFRQAMLSLIDDPAGRRAMGAAARSAAAGLSWQNVVRRILEIAAAAPVRCAA
jgi:glycosyltransferase involved in cell wall biosynthesis